MADLEEWLRNFLSTQRKVLTSEKQDEVLRKVDDLTKIIEDKDEGLAEGNEIWQLIERYIQQARPTMNNDQELILDPLCTKLLDLLVRVAVREKEIHDFLRDETTILSVLTSLLKDKYQKEDYTKILQAVEVLSRGLLLTWATPYLSHLIRAVFSVLLTADAYSDEFLYGLRIITNVVYNNRNCLTLVVKTPKYCDVMKRLYTLLSAKDHREVIAMNLNFGYLSDESISVEVQTQMKNVKKAFEELQAKVEAGGTVENVLSIAASIYYMTLCVSTLLDRIEKEHCEYVEKPGALSKGDVQRSSPVLIKSVTEDIMTIVFSKIFPKCLPVMRLQKGRVVLESMMGLMKALCPNYVSSKVYNDLWDIFVKSLNELALLTNSNSKAQAAVLEAHLHFVDRILDANPKNFRADSFTYALNNCQILLSATPLDTLRNIRIIRLQNRLNTLALSQKNTNDSVLTKTGKLMNEETLSKLLDLLLSQCLSDSSVPCVWLSTCVVEVLSVLSKSGKSPTTLIEKLHKENTWLHIANSIRSGDEDLVNLAFSVMSSVGFSPKCRSGVSRMLLMLREVVLIPTSPVKSPERSIYPTLTASRGFRRLNNNLEMFEQYHDESQDQDVMINDVLEWYKLKSDMHEMELASVNDSLFHLNRTNAQLKILLKKQAEVVSKRAIASATLKKDYIDLQKQLSLTTERKVELETKMTKAMGTLQDQLTYQESLYKSKCQKLDKLEKEHQKLVEYCAQLEANKDEVQQKSQQLAQEKKKLKEKLEETERERKTAEQKISSLENDLKKSEEGRKSVESQLEAERRKTEIIQQVLGNRMS